MLSVIGLRRYAEAKRLFDQAKDKTQVPTGSLMQEVIRNDVWLARELAKARAEKARTDAERRDDRSDSPTA